MASQTITVRAGDTEPLTINVDATNLTDLANASSAKLYLRKAGESSNHAEASVTIVSGAKKVTFDPAGAASGGGDALTEAGTYKGYVKITWTDGDVTRHPGDDDDDLTITVTPNLE